MKPETNLITTGIQQLDQLLGGLFIGDNVVWHDDAGSLAAVFCLNFMRASHDQGKELIYVSVDRSPRNLLDQLGPLAENPRLTILDCFTCGKGAGAEVFLNFYARESLKASCRILRVDQPADPNLLQEVLYAVHAELGGEVRFVFESLTGMAELWGGEERLLNFYAHSCPRLYELNTIAYWVIEKKAHAARVKAQINQIAQVAIDLSVKRGKTALTVLKAERRHTDTLNRPWSYWTKEQGVYFDLETPASGRMDLGTRLKACRSRQGLSQIELARLIGVTPSTISQVESNLIYPSVPALVKLAEVLGVEIGFFFKEGRTLPQQVVFPAGRAVEVKFPELIRRKIKVTHLLPAVDFANQLEPYLVEIPPRRKISGTFLVHKGHEFSYVLSGQVEIKLDGSTCTATAGDAIYFTHQIPTQLRNKGPEHARILWIKIK